VKPDDYIPDNYPTEDEERKMNKKNVKEMTRAELEAMFEEMQGDHTGQLISILLLKSDQHSAQLELVQGIIQDLLDTTEMLLKRQSELGGYIKSMGKADA